jgi:hypothetical protein
MKNCLGYAKDCCGIFLCEVALGKRLPRGYPISSADELPWHFISEGWCFPNKDEDVQLEGWLHL